MKSKYAVTLLVLTTILALTGCKCDESKLIKPIDGSKLSVQALNSFNTELQQTRGKEELTNEEIYKVAYSLAVISANVENPAPYKEELKNFILKNENVIFNSAVVDKEFVGTVMGKQTSLGAATRISSSDVFLQAYTIVGRDTGYIDYKFTIPIEDIYRTKEFYVHPINFSHGSIEKNIKVHAKEYRYIRGSKSELEHQNSIDSLIETNIELLKEMDSTQLADNFILSDTSKYVILHDKATYHFHPPCDAKEAGSNIRGKAKQRKFTIASNATIEDLRNKEVRLLVAPPDCRLGVNLDEVPSTNNFEVQVFAYNFYGVFFPHDKQYIAFVSERN